MLYLDYRTGVVASVRSSMEDCGYESQQESSHREGTYGQWRRVAMLNIAMTGKKALVRVLVTEWIYQGSVEGMPSH